MNRRSFLAASLPVPFLHGAEDPGDGFVFKGVKVGVWDRVTPWFTVRGPIVKDKKEIRYGLLRIDRPFSFSTGNFVSLDGQYSDHDVKTIDNLARQAFVGLLAVEEIHHTDCAVLTPLRLVEGKSWLLTRAGVTHSYVQDPLSVVVPLTGISLTDWFGD